MKLLSSNSDQVEIDTTGMSHCILTTAPSDCTNGGATYMFWIKQFDSHVGSILTTLDWSVPREGIRMTVNNGKLSVDIFREGNSLNRNSAQVENFGDHVESWLHVTIVWHTDPAFQFYYGGTLQLDTSPAYTTSSHNTYEAPLRMILGRLYVTKVEGQTKNMILDNTDVL